MTPEQLVQEQLESYNSRDLDRFINCFSENIILFNYFGNKQVVEGREAYKKIFADVFSQSPNLYAALINRIVYGNIVIDHELIKGRLNAPEPFEMVMIYEVEGDKIIKATAIRK